MAKKKMGGLGKGLDSLFADLSDDTGSEASGSTLLLREGVFNSMGPDVTVYIAERILDGRLNGLMIYDARPENPIPITILAREGRLTSTPNNQQIVVDHGARQTFHADTQVLERLNFDRYTIDLPDSGPISQRWAEPEDIAGPAYFFCSDDARYVTGQVLLVDGGASATF